MEGSSAASLGYPASPSSSIREELGCSIGDEQEDLASAHGEHHKHRGSSRVAPSTSRTSVLSVEMREVISIAIAQGIEEGRCQRAPRGDRSRMAQSHPVDTRESCQGSTASSITTEVSTWEEEHPEGYQLSEDEDLPLEKPAFTGLFKPSLFKSILHKARAATDLAP